MSAEESTSDRRRRKRDPENDPALCGHWRGENGDFHRNRAGERCGQNAIGGTHNCRSHPGKPLRILKQEGMVVMELRRWGLTGHAELDDPGETLLRLVTQSAARVEMYSRLLAEAYEAGERIAAAERAPDGGDLLSAESARMDLERVLNTGGVGALIGNTYAADKQAGIFATGEAIRGLARLEAEERDRCATFAAKAVAAGLAERMVRASEQVAALTAAAVERAMVRLGHDPRDPAVRAVVAEEMAALAGGPKMIEGMAA
jgi:hypothetical protein